MKVLAVQDMVIYRQVGGYSSYDSLVNWYGLLAKKADLTIAARVIDLDSISDVKYAKLRDIAVKTRLEDARLLDRMHPLDPSIKVVPLPDFPSIRQLIFSPGTMLSLFLKIRSIVSAQDVIMTNFASPSAVLTWMNTPGKTTVVAMLRGNPLKDVKYRYSGIDGKLAVLGVMGFTGITGLVGRFKSMRVLAAGMEAVRMAESLGLKAKNWYVSNISLQDIDRAKEFSRKYTDNGPVKLVAVTRFEQEKGVDVLIKAAALLHEHKIPFHLKIIGRGGLKGLLERQIMALGLQNNVELADFLPRQKLFEEYQKADILVNPSYTEGMPLIFFEAGLWKLPIVATAVGGIPDDYPHMQRAFLVKRADAGALAKGIMALVSDAGLRQRLGMAAHAFTCRHPMEKDLERQFKQFENWMIQEKI